MSISNIFAKLKNNSSGQVNGFSVTSLPLVGPHKLGVSEDGMPMFFVKGGKSQTKSLDYSLEYISVQFNRKCQLFLNGKPTAEGIYTVISLKTDLAEFQEYFLGVGYLLLRKISTDPNPKELRREIERLISLFSRFSEPPLKTIQGLWGELLVIEQSRNPSYLVQAWHCRPTDKYDFNDGTDKIEVKSTSKSSRIHAFSNSQLLPNKNSKLLIASLFVVETGEGRSVYDLVGAIAKKMDNTELAFRINEVVSQVLGRDISGAFSVHYDYQLAADSLSFYDSSSVARIREEDIPQQISNIHFDCDLTAAVKVKASDGNSALQKALF